MSVAAGAQEAEAALKRALDGFGGLQRQAQDLLRRVSDAVRDISTAAEAFESHMARARHQLDSERQEFEDQRLAFDQDKAMWKEVSSGQEPQPNEEAHPPLTSYENGQAIGEGHAGDSREAPLLWPKHSAGDGRSPKSGRDRSRSPRRTGGDRGGERPAEGWAVEESMWDAIRVLGLDENATRQLQKFAPEEAMTILDQVNDSVRNPSAFVTKTCLRKMDENQIEASLRDIGLDDSAARAVRELPTDQAVRVLEQVDRSVRNPSAFIMSLLKKGEKGKGGGKGAALDDRLQSRCSSLGLDVSAVRALNEMRPEDAWAILDQIGNDVRNPSAFVMSQVNKGGHQGGHGGKGGSGHKGYQEGKAGSNGGGEATLSQKRCAEGISSLARQLELDETCVEALHNLDQQDAVGILDKLTADLATIRNRSAFVFAEMKRRNAPPRTAKKTSGPVKDEPCRFYAQGRCKNGAECRFSHA